MTQTPSETVPKTPAAKAIAAFGSPKALADAIGRNVSRVHRWTYPPERGGTGGEIPGSALRDVLAAAKARGIALTADDLLTIEPPSAQDDAA